MLSQLLLHIGHQKTGTSSLQDTLRDNAQLLAGHGWHYEARLRAHHPFARSFRPEYRENGDTMRKATLLLRGLRRTSLPHALVSSEYFTTLSEAAVGEALASLRPLTRRLTVLLYVRHPLSFANSSAGQAARVGRPLAELVAAPPVLPLRPLVERWRPWLAHDELIVRPYERAQLARGDIIDDVLTVMGLEAVGPRLQRRQANEGLSTLAVHLIDRVHRMSGGQRVPIEALRGFEAIRGDRYVLPIEAQKKVMARGAADLAFLRDEFGITFEGLELPLTPSPPPALDARSLDDLAETLLRYGMFAHRVEQSRLGRRFGARAPFTRAWDGRAGPVGVLTRRLGLDTWIVGRPIRWKRRAEAPVRDEPTARPGEPASPPAVPG